MNTKLKILQMALVHYKKQIMRQFKLISLTILTVVLTICGIWSIVYGIAHHPELVFKIIVGIVVLILLIAFAVWIYQVLDENF